jgi:hypothetical protein
VWSKIKKNIKSLFKNLVTDVEVSNEQPVEVKNNIEEVQNTEASPNTVKVAILSDDKPDLTLNELESLLKEMLGSSSPSKKKAKIPYVLMTEGPEWFYDPVNKQMIRVHPGAELILSDPEPDDDGRIMCYCELGFIMVPSGSVEQLGFN